MPRPSPTREAPRRGRPGYDQETVLRHAIDLFNRRGYDGTSVGDLARELGLTKSAIYHHFPSKSYLLQAALTEALDALEEVVDTAATAGEDSGPSAYARLESVLRQAVGVLVEHLPAVTLLLRVHGNSDVELDALRRRREIDAKLAALVRAAADEGSLRADIPPELTSRLLFGMVNSLVEWYRPEGRYDAAGVADAVIRIAFEGLALRGE
ncbi:TetR/AcrR family transcriptional regulator [Streptomonospora litoralis]|uniref:HTH-type transcriptional repressor KstR2 n=1 Tax=Streptomonospora litoralis TaxID=2498135 RepID=A0A4V0ZJI2_9ACTN|nr:TetR/AcrR family transcriptional regulator [Streptomonospora litoralis]QBI53572.1 HTH-type transcriptional repressor KstR2 [Streptomonospora litoralis]